MIYGVGWGSFKNVIAIKEARNRVCSLVDKLKARFLLLEGNCHDQVKIHDVVRDVMILIACQYKGMHNIANIDKFDQEFSAKKRLNDSTAISFLVTQHDNKLPERLQCPQLKLLLMFNRSKNYLQIPEQYFEEKKELKLRCLKQIHVGSFPTSFRLLQNLQELCLYSCMGNLGINERLKNLKILDLAWSEIEELPSDTGQLTHLQMLNLEGCTHLKVIQPGVISSLIGLEELNMKGVSLKWRDEGCNGGRRNAGLIELKTSSQLTTLHLTIQNVKILPKALFSEKLKKFELSIGDISIDLYRGNILNLNCLHLKLFESDLLSERGLEMIMKRTKRLYLYGFKGVNNIVYELDKEGFRQLKSFEFEDKNEIKYIVNSVDTQPCSVFQNLEDFVTLN